MPYSADINRANPGCFLFLIDQSGSMADALAGTAWSTENGPSSGSHKRNSQRLIPSLLSGHGNQRLLSYRDYQLYLTGFFGAYSQLEHGFYQILPLTIRS